MLRCKARSTLPRSHVTGRMPALMAQRMLAGHTSCRQNERRRHVRDERSLLAVDVIVIPIFTRGVIGSTHVPIQARVGGLDLDSVISCEQITAHDAGFPHEGPLADPVTEPLLRQLVEAVRIAIGNLPVPGA